MVIKPFSNVSLLTMVDCTGILGCWLLIAVGLAVMMFESNSVIDYKPLAAECQISTHNLTVAAYFSNYPNVFPVGSKTRGGRLRKPRLLPSKTVVNRKSS